MKCFVRFHQCVWIPFQFPGCGKKKGGERKLAEDERKRQVEITRCYFVQDCSNSTVLSLNKMELSYTNICCVMLCNYVRFFTLGGSFYLAKINRSEHVSMDNETREGHTF
jgi:hypothetical protein